jgi:endonuclease/exonuclease/phosphatase (EEP) superfamily protein YafD
MSIPLRFVATTYNLWAENRWPDREAALRAYLQTAAPDILALQELRQATRDVLDEVLPGHRRVEDDFEGWMRESNIYWLDSMFELVEYGADEILRLSRTDEFRRLFWARLRVRDSDSTLVVSTAHYTYQGHPDECATGQSPRPEQARQTLEILGRVAQPGESVIFMGDLNDPVNALRVLREGGLRENCESLEILPSPTFPAFPTSHSKTVQVLDWQFHRGPLRVMSSEVRDFFLGDLAPSDHKPLTVTYGLEVDGNE